MKLRKSSRYKISFAKSATKDLQKLDRNIQLRITRKIEYFQSQPNPIEYATTIKNSHKDFYRFRIGSYRAVFKLNDKHIIILTIKHRKEVYKKL